MDALIYTKDDGEYGMLSRIFMEELPDAVVERGLLDGHMHMEKEYDVVVVDMDGAEGMEYVCKYRAVYGNTLVVWITNDRYFAGVAIRLHVFEFILRPLEEGGFREPLKRIKDGDVAWWQVGPVKDSIYQAGCPVSRATEHTRENNSERREIPPKARRNGTIWTRIRDYFLSENTL